MNFRNMNLIAVNTFRNELRNRGFIFMGVMTFLVMTIGFIVMDYVLKEFVDPGTFKLAGNTALYVSYRFIMFWTFLIGLNFGINCIRNDLSYGTLSLILSFPVSRLEYFLGRIGGAFIMSVIYFLMAFLYSVIALTIMSKEIIFHISFLYAFFISGLGLLMWIVMASFISIYFSRLTSFFIICFTYLIVSSSDQYFSSIPMGDWFATFSPFKVIGVVIYALFPHLQSLSNFAGEIIQGEVVDYGINMAHVGHGLITVGLIVFVYNLYFSKKDIN